MKKQLLTLVMLVSIFAFGNNAFAQMNMGEGNPAFGQPHGMMKQKLGLNEEQAKKFDQIMFDQKEAMIDTRAQIQKLKVEAQKIAASDNVDLNKLKKINAKIENLRTAQKDRRLETWEKVNKILTPEQKKIWKNMLNKMIMMQGKKGMGHKGMRKGMMKKRMRMQNGGNGMMGNQGGMK